MSRKIKMFGQHKKSACVTTVIGAYRVNSDVERVNAAFEKYNALERTIRENEKLS